MPEPAEKSTSEITARLDRAELLLSLGKSSDAATMAAELLAAAERDWRVHDVIARVHLHDALRLRREGLMDHSAEELAASVEAYRAATALAPSLAGLHQSAANAASMAGKHEQAIDWFEHAMELDSTDPRAPLCLAQLIFDADPTQARRLLEKALALDPSIAEAHASVALLEATEGREEAATAAMANALACGEAGPAIRVVQAKMYRLLENPARGVEILLALPVTARGEEATATELARCWQSLGRADRAADAWGVCFTANAHRTDAWAFALKAAEAHLLAGNRASAASCIAQAEMLSAPPERLEAVRKLARVQGE
jgi:Flp pilus assembly protein TadD